ncbi:hypothetical protein [Lyngbya aestuarii]|uniref:hypothetical protein n=1 Tax=Lyngbya aestuarii TaxID=118322 RepID=UPI00403DEA4D
MNAVKQFTTNRRITSLKFVFLVFQEIGENTIKRSLNPSITDLQTKISNQQIQLIKT